MNKSVLGAIIVFFLLISGTTAYTQTTYKLTVSELFDKGLEYSLTINSS